MAIILYTGNVGSGKTIMAERDMLRVRMPTYTNIIQKKNVPHIHEITASNIIKKVVTGHFMKGERKGEPKYDFKLNMDFWDNLEKPLSVVLDEAHTLYSSRNSMSLTNRLISEWLALIRKITSTTDRDGDLTMITQFPRKIDVNMRDMATRVQEHLCHYIKICPKCRSYWYENSDVPEPVKLCSCGNWDLKKRNRKIEILKFSNISDYEMYKATGKDSYAYSRQLMKGLNRYFEFYDTETKKNLFENFL